MRWSKRFVFSPQIAPSCFNFGTSSIFLPLLTATRFSKPQSLNISTSTTSCVSYRVLTDLISVQKKFIARSKRSSPQGMYLPIGQNGDFNMHISQYTTIDIIKQAITILEAGHSIVSLHISGMLTFIQGRLTNLYDIPRHAPYLFVEPDLTTKEAQSMLDNVPADVYGRLLCVNLDQGFSALFSSCYNFYCQGQARNRNRAMG